LELWKEKRGGGGGEKRKGRGPLSVPRLAIQEAKSAWELRCRGGDSNEKKGEEKRKRKKKRVTEGQRRRREHYWILAGRTDLYSQFGFTIRPLPIDKKRGGGGEGKKTFDPSCTRAIRRSRQHGSERHGEWQNGKARRSGSIREKRGKRKGRETRCFDASLNDLTRTVPEKRKKKRRKKKRNLQLISRPVSYQVGGEKKEGKKEKRKKESQERFKM